MATGSLKLPRGLFSPDSSLEILGKGFSWAEGPVWNGSGRFLLFSDMPQDVRRRWSGSSGLQQVLRPTRKANGLTYDADGALIACEHGSRSVVRERGDGSGRDRVVLASHYEGKELNSPNDVVVAHDGTIYFTDPTYGRSAEFGVAGEPELDFRGLFRLLPNSGDLQLLAADFEQPNGLCFSPAEDRLYVNDTERAHIRVFEVRPDGTLGADSVFADGLQDDEVDGVPDGMKCDRDGNVFVTGPGGIWIFSPEGEHLGGIEVPGIVSNLAWGGATWSELFLTETSRLYRIETRTQGDAVPHIRSVVRAEDGEDT